MVKGRKRLDRRKPKKNRVSNNKLKILIPLVFMLIIANLALEHDKSTNQDKVNFKTVNVLIYNGTGASSNCVSKIEDCLDKSNERNLTSNVKFSYKTSEVIDNKTLSGYDVLVMPGSSEGYDYLGSDEIDANAVKNFVASGKGYLGICAGAYSGAQYTEDWYDGWGIAPHVINEHPLDTGNLTVNITSAGNELFGYSGKQIMPHINGPAMYASGGDVVTFATYADDNTDYEGSAAVIGDHYGKGRSVLSGVHPELEPEHPDMLAYMILWAYNGTFDFNKTSIKV